MAPMLDRLGVMTQADELALAELCEAFADVMALRASLANPVEAPDGEGGFVTVAQAGELIYTARGREGWTIRARPEAAMLEPASKRFHALLGQFGLTPATRSKITVTPADATGLNEYFSD